MESSEEVRVLECGVGDAEFVGVAAVVLGVAVVGCVIGDTPVVWLGGVMAGYAMVLTAICYSPSPRVRGLHHDDAAVIVGVVALDGAVERLSWRERPHCGLYVCGVGHGILVCCGVGESLVEEGG